MQRHISQVNNLDDLDHSVELLFYLLKGNIIACNANSHSGNSLILCGSNRKRL